MPPVESEEIEGYYSRGGDFTSPKKLLTPGETKRVKLLDLSKQHQTKYPIKDKDYCYRLSLQTEAGATLKMDMNGGNLISQVMRALYPDGPTKPMQPGWATITRRTERTTKQSELVVVREANQPVNDSRQTSP